jgi:F-type H+-transporting ATPase subunit alpha
MVEILKQPQFRPMHVVDQILIIYAGANGFLDKVPLDRVRDYEERMLAYVRESHASFRDAFIQKKALDDATDAELKRILGEFSEAYVAGRTPSPV